MRFSIIWLCEGGQGWGGGDLSTTSWGNLSLRTLMDTVIYHTSLISLAKVWNAVIYSISYFYLKLAFLHLKQIILHTICGSHLFASLRHGIYTVFNTCSINVREAWWWDHTASMWNSRSNRSDFYELCHSSITNNSVLMCNTFAMTWICSAKSV